MTTLSHESKVPKEDTKQLVERDQEIRKRIARTILIQQTLKDNREALKRLGDR
ncbi:hypothetical protein ACFYKX_10455 [Cytobacillus sp. FJAT-54145]|uniref:Uncharacterized protein n=1 Tax=Cytobacillus spartinae TaxID=3299023 RepID=A0ABW6K9Z4_9BACI